ncbi:pyridoxal phosphate-dependent aminotransferase [Ferruginivarius sediminum]|uniref:Aminotransferase n=1 Tax=Ferruginivarius sediminum TaxID=2661937 RepID=A0A369TJD4_9PROT|nr:pyridoxal phosphate-dependent aminotransferase [Ferruginivarius sediminum]RDD63006.1 pyridoxal phosphate-dependent aminotransferase [Ferruginivarius sediminum]
MALKVSNRAGVSPFIVMDVMRAANERAAAGGDVLHLEVGQPGHGAPEGAIRAAERALRSERLGYTDACGYPELRERIALHYRGAYGVGVDPASVMVTTGSSAAFMLAFVGAFDVGDRVALAAPGYPAYRNILSALGLEPVWLETGPEHRFQPTPELLDKVEGGIDGLIVASPSNPTGTMLDQGAMQALVDACRARGIRLISDEIYHGIEFTGRAVSALEFGDDAIVVNSFSKYYAMTGWRLGWLVLPDDLRRPVECLGQNLYISPPAVSQAAGLAAMDCHEELDLVVAGYRRNRDLLLEELPKAGFDKLAPADGAFYIYADIGHLSDDSQDFCKRMLAQTGVAATPGIDFDPARGRRYMRFSFAGPEAEMAEAAKRLRKWLQG